MKDCGLSRRGRWRAEIFQRYHLSDPVMGEEQEREDSSWSPGTCITDLYQADGLTVTGHDGERREKC